MKQKFTIFLAAFALLAFLSVPLGMRGQAPVNTVLWGEDFSGFSNNVDPSGDYTNSHTGTTVYGGVTITYSKTNGGGTTQTYTSDGPNNNSNLLIAKNNGTFTISGISTGDATELTVSYAMSGSGVIAISSSTSGVSISGSTITTNGASTIAITFTNTASSANLRIDDIAISVKTAGSGAAPTHTLTFTANPVAGGTVTVDNSTTGSATIAENATVNISAVANTGYVFDSWTVTDTGSSVDDEDAATTTFTMGTVDATLTANFSTVTTYTVTYIANGGTGNDIVETYNEGADVTVAANTFNYAGHAFTKWHTNTAGTGGTDYNPGDVIEDIDDDIDLYAQWEESNETVDVLNREFTGINDGGGYSAWQDKKGASGAVYAGRSGGNNNSIQLNSTSPNGFVSTTSGGKVTKVVVTWHNNTTNGRSVDIYGSNTAYEGSSDLYDTNKQGTKLGSIVKGTSTELVISGDYHYIGFRNPGNAVYLSEVRITWESSGTPTPSITISDNDELAYNANSGSFNFEVSNPVDGGTTSVAEDVDWISNAAVSGNSVTFNTTTNEAGTARSGVVTLTYTYNTDQTVTKDVTVTQAGNPDATMTIAEVRLQGTGDVVTRGTVTSITGTNAKTAYIQDANAAIVVYGNFTAAVGDEIRVSGTLSSFNGLLEITSPTVTVISSGNTVNPELMTIEAINASTNQGWYVRIENATVTEINDKNTTIAQGANTIVVYDISGVTINVNDVISLNGNIGYHNAIQIANPQNVEVQQNTEPSITLNTYTVESTADETEGNLAITLDNIVITETGGGMFDYIICDAEGTALSDPSTVEAWLALDFPYENNTFSVYYVISENTTTTARTAYFKVYGLGDDGQTEAYSNLVTVTQAAFAVDYATLPFAFDGGRDDIATTNGLTHTGLGTDYNDSPKLKFDTQGDELVLKINEAPGELTFDIKGNGSGTWAGTFVVQASVDGETYTDIATYTTLGATETKTINTLASTVRYIKWYFYEKTTGFNVALGNINLAAYTAPTPTITVASNLIEVTAADTTGTLTVTYTEIETSTGIEIHWFESDGTTSTTEPNWISAEINTSLNVDYVIGENDGDARNAYFKVYGVDADANDVYSELVTITQAAAPEMALYTYSINGVEGATFEKPVGESFTLAQGEDLNTNFTFVGWTLDPNDVSQRLTTYTFDAEDAYVFYAVYAHTTTNGNSTSKTGEASYVKVTNTADLTDGNYLIVYEEGAVAFDGSRDNDEDLLDASGNTISVDVDEGVIASNANTDAAVFAINVSVGTIQSASGFYVGQTSDANGMAVNDETAYTHTITIDNEENAVIQSSGGAYMRFNSTSGQERFRYFRSATYTNQKAIQLYKYTVSGGTPTPVSTTAYYTRVFLDNPTGNVTIAGPSIIPSGETLDMGANTLTNTLGATKLIIEDGAQLKISNQVKGTLQKNIAGYGESTNADYYLVASPFDGQVSNINNFRPETSDMNEVDWYEFDESKDLEWRNKKYQAGETWLFDGQTGVQRGKGYLYARKNGVVLGFAASYLYTFIGGEPTPEDEYLSPTTETYTVPTDDLSYTEGGNFAGWNLVGNPFTCDAYVNRTFFRMNPTGSAIIEGSGTVKPGEGVFVVVTNDDKVVKFSTSNPPVFGAKLAINLNENNTLMDRAVVNFKGSQDITKFVFNESTPKLSILRNGKDYAVVRSEAQGELPVNFKAAMTGTYTLSVETENLDVTYLHLIDNLTGADVDLLATPSYTFEGKKSDYESRFRLVFSANDNTGNTETGDTFAFFDASGNLVVNGDGMVQVIDIMGRIIVDRRDGACTVSTANVAPGVYVLRLINGDNVKTQKIVVK